MTWRGASSPVLSLTRMSPTIRRQLVPAIGHRYPRRPPLSTRDRGSFDAVMTDRVVRSLSAGAGVAFLLSGIIPNPFAAAAVAAAVGGGAFFGSRALRRR